MTEQSTLTDSPLNMEELKTLLFTNMGAVSMAWEHIPKGVFDSTEANRLGTEVFTAIEKKVDTYHRRLAFIKGYFESIIAKQDDADKEIIADLISAIDEDLKGL